ncbi:MAG: DUF72 domain-containing protein [Gammaproteobacteria bacterium]
MRRTGTAGWSIPRALAATFPGDGTHLARYARLLSCVEINSSFYRPHRPTVYARWAAQTPDDFRFSVKMPRAITHEARLMGAGAELESFLLEIAGLGTKLGIVLVQLPPSLDFDVNVTRAFLDELRSRHEGPVACEPRHGTWFSAAADTVLATYRVGRVAADPAVCPDAARPGGWPDTTYYRLHGSPRRYWSSYSPDRLRAWSAEMAALPASANVWCILDNTAAGAALENALEMIEYP